MTSKLLQIWNQQLDPKTGWSRARVGPPSGWKRIWEAGFAPGAGSGGGARVNWNIKKINEGVIRTASICAHRHAHM